MSAKLNLFLSPETETMKPNLSLLTTGALALAASTATAQYAPPPPTQPFPGFANQYLRAQDPYWSNWDFGAQLRLRYEIKDNGGFTATGAAADFRKSVSTGAAGTDNDNSYFMSKLLVRAGYTDKWWSAFLQGRQSTTTGDDRNPNVESDGPMDLHQAYVTLGNHKEFPVSLKVGRQELSYGEERLVGAFGWNNVGRVFDAAKARWQSEHFTAEAFTGRVIIPDDNNFNKANDYDWFSGLYVTTKAVPKQTTDFYIYSRNVSTGSATANTIGLPAALQTPLNGSAPRDIYTFGVRGKSNPGELGNWDYLYELMGQFGHFNDTARAASGQGSLEHEAYAMVLQGGYTFAAAPWTPRLSLEYSYASGDKNPTDTKHGTFENLFPTNHKFYGYMDLVSLQNIHDVRLMLTAKPTARLSLSVEGHLFWLDSDMDNFYAVSGARRGAIASTPGTGYGLNSSYSKFVGGEIDVIAGYTLSKFASLEAGFGHFFTGSYLASTFSAIGGAQDANFFYVQTSLNF